MLPSATVENYLKAIYAGVSALAPPARLLPMGQLASALGVAPGTATTMVKTLADSGLAEYEPYAGVALTPAGERLAALVLRRHRLVELFLVRVMGYAWDEVHDEAEQLEHVVSDRLIDRIDQMLGRPETDPHGDPIPTSDGRVRLQHAQSLLTCPLHTPVVVTRILDQEAAFLRFVERHQLKPGESIEVEQRDAASDSVCVRGRRNQQITIGMRAASKLLVQLAGAIALLVALALPAAAQDQPGEPPFGITDNSLLIEEAFNQEVGVVQTIGLLHLTDAGTWETTVTQEWPLFSHAHQISYTISVAAEDGSRGLGDAQLHYRLQVRDESARGPAIAPRVSLILPTGNAARDLGAGHPGWQVNVPISKRRGPFYVHGNAGFTHLPAQVVAGRNWNLFTPHAGGSLMWRARPLLHLLVEGLAERREEVEGAATARHAAFTLSPGVRRGWNHGDQQVVLALGVPIERVQGTTRATLLAYLSYELPFRK